MLTDGFNHVALLTNHSARLHEFYRAVFDAEVVDDIPGPPDARLSFIKIGPDAEFNVFEIVGNVQAQRQTPMFERGRIDHLGLNAASLEAFDEIRRRLIERGAADEFVTDFGPVLSVFFRDPDGLEGEVCIRNPDAVPGQVNAPGTPAARYAAG